MLGIRNASQDCFHKLDLEAFTQFKLFTAVTINYDLINSINLILFWFCCNSNLKIRNGKDFLLPTDKRRQHIQPIINENPLLDKIDLFELRRILRIPDTEEIQRYQNWGNLRNYFEDVTDEFEDWIKSKSPPSTYIFRQI